MSMPPSMPSMQPATRLRGCLIAFIIAALVLLVGIIGAIVLLGPLGRALNGVTTSDHTVTFKVTATAKTVVSYGAAGVSSSDTVTAKWTKEEKISGSQVVTLAMIIDAAAPDDATATCQIMIDGRLKSTTTVTGPAAIGACDAKT